MSNNTNWGPGSYERGLPSSEQYGPFPERERPSEQRSYIPPVTPGGPSYGPPPGGFQAGYGPYPGNGYYAQQQVYEMQMPQGGYYAPYDEADPLPPRPLPLSEAIRQLPGQYWRVFTKPQEATFREEQRKAAWNIVWVQLAILGVLTALAILVMYNVTLPAWGLIMGMPFGQTASLLSSISGIAAVAALVLTPVSFFASMGIYHLIAKAFKGRGQFLTYSYCYLLFGVPLTLISFIVAMIPAGFYLLYISVSYQLVVQIFMTSAVHRLGRGKASLIVLLPVIIVFALYILLVVLLVMIIATGFFASIYH